MDVKIKIWVNEMSVRDLFVKKKAGKKATTFYVLGIPLLKIKDKNRYRSIYLMGIRIFRKVCQYSFAKDIAMQKKENLQRLLEYDEKRYMSRKPANRALFLGKYCAPTKVARKLFEAYGGVFDVFANEFEEQIQENAFSYVLWNSGKVNRNNYEAKLYILGNSEHHQSVVNELIQTKNEKNRVVSLAEPILLSAVINHFYLGSNDLVEFVQKYYPELNNNISELLTVLYPPPTESSGLTIWDFVKKYKISFVRPFIEMTGVDKFLVCSEAGKNFLLADLEKSAYAQSVKVDSFPNVYERTVCHERYDFNLGGYKVVGTFGIPQKEKQTNLIIEAIDILCSKGEKVKLLLAGPQVKEYTQNLDTSNCIIYDFPSDSEWLKLMNSCDLVVQLRPHLWAASSGCTSEAISLKKPLLVTKGLVEHEFEDLCYLVDSDITAWKLADAIGCALKDKTKNTATDEIIEKYSFNNVGHMIIDKFENLLEK